jgi:hypothetical protein
MKTERDEIRRALVEELIVLNGSRRGSAGMAALVESGQLDPATLPGERAILLGRRLLSLGCATTLDAARARRPAPTASTRQRTMRPSARATTG